MSALFAHARRDGFTLLELLIVTIILGILFMLAAPKVAEMRESAFIVATKAEVKSAEQSIEMYRVIHGAYPKSLGDLQNIGFIVPGEIKYCKFEYVSGRGRDDGSGDGGGASEEYVLVAAMHEGSHSLVTTHYRTWNGRVEVTEIEGDGCPSD